VLREVPGVEGKDIDIHVTREAVAISGEHRFEDQEGLLPLRVPLRQFQRVIPCQRRSKRAGKG